MEARCRSLVRCAELGRADCSVRTEAYARACGDQWDGAGTSPDAEDQAAVLGIEEPVLRISETVLVHRPFPWPRLKRTDGFQIVPKTHELKGSRDILPRLWLWESMSRPRFRREALTEDPLKDRGDSTAVELQGGKSSDQGCLVGPPCPPCPGGGALRPAGVMAPGAVPGLPTASPRRRDSHRRAADSGVILRRGWISVLRALETIFFFFSVAVQRGT